MVYYASQKRFVLVTLQQIVYYDTGIMISDVGGIIWKPWLIELYLQKGAA